MMIISLLVIIVVLLVVLATMIPNTSKQTTKLTFESGQELNESDSIQIRLTGANGTGLVNQSLNIAMKNENKSDYQSVVTNEDGIGTLKFNKTAGEYNVTVSYGGNDNYAGCNGTQKIKIKQNVVEEPTQKSSSSSYHSDDGYWETSIDAPFEYHTEYDSSGGFCQYDRAGNLVGSSYDEDQDKIASYVPRRI